MIAVLFGLFLVVLAFFAYAGFSAAPWVPARQKDMQALLDLAASKEGGTYFELGCGDGRVVVQLSKLAGNVVGYEINPVLWLIAKWRTRKIRNAQIKLGSLWRVDLASADVIVVFLMQKHLPKLEKKIISETKPGTILLSYIFNASQLKQIETKNGWRSFKV